MKLEAQIRELLYQYDCVIVPGFGGFICNFSPAKIHPVQHKFYPPSKTISFNQLLQVNDGLLAHYSARSGKISYETAVENIHAEVVRWKNKLSSGEKLILEEIGEFFNDQGGNLQFNPSADINFLRDSFGLTVFQSLPVKQTEKLKIVHQKESTENRKIPTEVDWTKLAKYAAAAAVISVVSLTSIKLDLINEFAFNQIGMNPFKSESPVYKSTKHRAIPDAAIQLYPSEIHENIEKSDDTFVKYVLDGKELTVRLHKKIIEERTSESLVSNYAYHVVGGCFGVKSNALKLNKKLQGLGYQSNIIGRHKDLYVVSYQSFSTKSEARSFLNKVKREHNAQAWLLKK